MSKKHCYVRNALFCASLGLLSAVFKDWLNTILWFIAGFVWLLAARY